MEKNIKLKDERKINVITNEKNENAFQQITESFAVDGLTFAHYSLTKSNKFVFNAVLDLDFEIEENKKDLIFEIESDHPLYDCYSNLLDNDKELIIYDEENNNKYLKINNNDEKISLTFVDKTEEKKLKNKFMISFSNKLDYLKDKNTIIKNDVKNKLNCFFDEICDLLIYGSHQISMDEYYLKKKIV